MTDFVVFRQFAKMETRVALFVVALSLMVAMALGAVPKTPSLEVSPANTAAVDVGIVITFTCVKDPTDGDPTGWEFYVDSSTTKITGATVSGAVYTPSTATAAAKKQITCKARNGDGPSADASAAKDLTVTAIPAPTLTSSIPKGTDGKVNVNKGSTVKFTCAKAASAKQAPIMGFKFYKDTTEIQSGQDGAVIDGGELTVTTTDAWKEKVVKCAHVNTASLKTDSADTFTVSLVPDPPTIDFTSPLKPDQELKVTCKKTGTDFTITGYEIYKGTEQLKTDLSGTLSETYTKAKVTIADDNDKKFKCRAKNAEGFSEFSAEKTLVVAGAASQLVSMTTMALVLALGAFFKE